MHRLRPRDCFLVWLALYGFGVVCVPSFVFFEMPDVDGSDPEMHDLEAHTKVLGRPILIDEHTRAGLSSAVRVEDHGPVQVKTRAQPVRVYSVVPGD